MIQNQLASDSHAVTHTHCSTSVRSAIICSPTHFKAEYPGECIKKRLKYAEPEKCF